MFRSCVVLIGTLVGFLPPSLPQTHSPADGPWSGSAQCQITVQGNGYSDVQTHSWAITSGAPTTQGAIRLFASTWSVTGGGSLQRTQGNQTLKAQWETSAQSSGAPISVFVRASDGRLLIKSGHAQLRTKGGITGSQQLFENGKPKPSSKISAEAFEWQLPVAEDNSTATNIQGSNQQEIKASVGLMQPAGSKVIASCTWSFSRPASTPIANGTH